MTRKREEGGRFASEGRAPTEKRVVKAPRPRYCRVFARARVAEALPSIVEKLVEESKKGSVAHLKLLLKTAGLDTREMVPRAMQRPGKSLETILMEAWKADDEKVAREKAALSAAEAGHPE